MAGRVADEGVLSEEERVMLQCGGFDVHHMTCGTLLNERPIRNHANLQSASALSNPKFALSVQKQSYIRRIRVSHASLLIKPVSGKKQTGSRKAPPPSVFGGRARPDQGPAVRPSLPRPSCRRGRPRLWSRQPRYAPIEPAHVRPRHPSRRLLPRLPRPGAGPGKALFGLRQSTAASAPRT